MLSHVLHDWPDEVCVRILTRCRRAMGPDARVFIIEGVVPLGNDFSIAKQLDLEVVLMGGCKERTIEEFEELLRRSGLRLAKRVDTRDYISVLEGVAQ